MRSRSWRRDQSRGRVDLPAAFAVAAVGRKDGRRGKRAEIADENVLLRHASMHRLKLVYPGEIEHPPPSKFATKSTEFRGEAVRQFFRNFIDAAGNAGAN